MDEKEQKPSIYEVLQQSAEWVEYYTDLMGRFGVDLLPLVVSAEKDLKRAEEAAGILEVKGEDLLLRA